MWLADADGHALAGLAAHADAGVELHVVTDHGDAVHGIRSVADQHGALDRVRHLAVLDHVGLGAGEDELAAGDVDLAAAKGDGIDALLDRGNDLLRRVVAGSHVGVGHARHRLVRVGFAPAVAGGRHAHQAGVLPVLHVADQLSVLDQDGSVGRRALVVDGQRAATFGNGAVIDDGYALRRHLLAHQTGEGRRLLAVEIAFQPVTDSLMQHHARPSCRQHDVECAGGCRLGRQIDQCLTQGLLGAVFPAVLGNEFAERLATAHAIGAAFLAVAVTHDNLDVEPHKRTNVAGKAAVGAQDLDMLPGGGERSGDLTHARVASPQPGIDFLQQLCFLLEARCCQRVLVAVELAVGAGGRRCQLARIAGLHGRDGVGGSHQCRFAQFAGMGIAGCFPRHCPKTEAGIGVVVGGLQATIVEKERLALARFEEQLAIIGTMDRIRYDAAQGLFGNVEPFDQPGSQDRSSALWDGLASI